MNIVLLGGNSQRNKEWIQAVGKTVAPDFSQTVIHMYDHWENGNELADVESELAKLQVEVQNLGQYIVFAKSIGSIITLTGISKGILAPQACIFVGLPIKLAVEEHIDMQALLGSNTIPTLLIHNDHDPVATFEEVNSLAVGAGSGVYKTEMLIGDTHSYDDLEGLRQSIQDFVN